MSLGEAFAGNDLVRSPGIDVTALAEDDVVEDFPPDFGNRDQAPGGRLLHAFDVESDFDHDASLHLRYAGNRPDALAEQERGAFKGRENVGEALAFVVRLAGRLQGVEGAQVHDVREHAHPDHHADRETLALDPPKVAEQLAIECLHGLPPELIRRNLFVVALVSHDTTVGELDHAVGDIRDGGVMGDHGGGRAEFAIDALDGL